MTREEINRVREMRPGNADNSDLDELTALLDTVVDSTMPEPIPEPDPSIYIDHTGNLDGIEANRLNFNFLDDGTRTNTFTTIGTDTSTQGTIRINSGSNAFTVSGDSLTVSGACLGNMDLTTPGIIGGSLSQSISSTYPGLHPELHEVYATLIDSLRFRLVDDVTLEVIQCVRDALQRNLDFVNNDVDMRSNMFSYLEYLTNRLAEYNSSSLSEPLTEEELNKLAVNDRERAKKIQKVRKKDNRPDKRSGLLAPMGFEYTYHISPLKTLQKLTGLKRPDIEHGIYLLRIKLKK